VLPGDQICFFFGLEEAPNPLAVGVKSATRHVAAKAPGGQELCGIPARRPQEAN